MTIQRCNSVIMSSLRVIVVHYRYDTDYRDLSIYLTGSRRGFAADLESVCMNQIVPVEFVHWLMVYGLTLN